MKTIIIIISIILLSIGNTFASNYKLTTSDKVIVNKLSTKIQILLDNNSLGFRNNIQIKINEIQQQYKNSKKLYSIFEQIKINTHLYNHKVEYNKHYNKFNIDINKIKKLWLSWHNEARINLGVTKYSYDKRLDNTSYEWSKVQSKEKKIMSHKRSEGGLYYDYHEIEKWFNDRGVKCEVSGGATSSESIGKFGYYCNDNECSDELIKSLKTIFDIYMAEKGLSYPANAHYKGITLPELSKVGIGLYIEERYDDTYKNYRSYDYYVTTHYCTKFKK